MFIKIRRLLAKHEIRTFYMLGNKTFHTVRLVKDTLGLKIPGVYCIPLSTVRCMWDTLEEPYGRDIREIRPIHHGQPEDSQERSDSVPVNGPLFMITFVLSKYRMTLH
jgi:hypothetical protein